MGSYLRSHPWTSWLSCCIWGSGDAVGNGPSNRSRVYQIQPCQLNAIVEAGSGSSGQSLGGASYP